MSEEREDPTSGTLDVPTPRLLNAPRVPIRLSAEGTRAPLAGGAAVTAACHLIPAMRLGIPLRLDEAPDPTLAAGLPALVERLAAFDPSLRQVAVRHPAPVGAAEPVAAGVGMFFTGGVDSFHHLLVHGDGIDTLVYVVGYDLPSGSPVLGPTRAMLDAVAARTGRRLVVVTSTLRDHLDRQAAWGTTHGAALAAVAHALRGELGTIHVPSSFHADDLHAWGSHPELDGLWSSGSLRIVHGDVATGRREKVRAIATAPVALDHLRVCWENRDGAYNCCRCAKCVRTMLDLELAGALDRARTFPAPLDAARVRALGPLAQADRIFLRDVARGFEEAGRAGDPLAAAVRDVLARDRVEIAEPAPPLVVGPARVAHDGRRVQLAADVRQGAVETTVRIAYDAAEPPPRPGDALAVLFTLHAMGREAPLVIEDAVSADVLGNLLEAQRRWAILPAFSPTRVVPIEAATVAPPLAARPGRGWATAFTGGVDSWHTALRHRERLRRLVLLHGIDEEDPEPGRRARMGAWLREDADLVGVAPLEVDVNVRRVIVRDLGGRWDEAYAIAPVAVAHLISGEVERFLMPGEVTYRELQEARRTTKYHPYVDGWIGGAAIAIESDGMDVRRHDKVAWLAAEHPEAVPRLRVCFADLTEGHVGGPNCGRCEKCLRTLAALRMCGRDELAAQAFDAPLDLERLAATEVPVSTVGEVRTTFHLAMLDELRRRGEDVPLQAALRGLLVRSAAALPHGPETRLHDPVGGFRASPAWAEYVAGDAPTWLHALLAHMPAEDVRAALLADPEVPALLARARRGRRR